MLEAHRRGGGVRRRADGGGEGGVKGVGGADVGDRRDAADASTVTAAKLVKGWATTHPP